MRAPVAPKIRLGDATAHGFGWLLGLNLGSKVLAFVCQLIVSWLVCPEQFGRFSMAMAVYVLVGVIQQWGLSQQLIQRHRQIKVWANAAFWMSLLLGALGGLTMLLLAGPAAVFYDSPRVYDLLLILAASQVCTAVGLVPQARLLADMRYRGLAVFSGAAMLLQNVSMVILAWLDQSSFSLIWPILIGRVALTGVLWWVAPVPLRASLQWRRWRYLLPSGFTLTAANTLFILISQGDYIVLGLMFPGQLGDQVVGWYFFAFNYATQFTQLVVVNFSAVLLSPLSRVTDHPRKMLEGSQTAIRLVNLFYVPMIFYQVALARPLFEVLFSERWQPAILPFQILSLGMLNRVLGATGGAVFTAQRRFAGFLRQSIMAMFLFFALVVPATWHYEFVGTSVAVGLFYFCFEPFEYRMSIRTLGGGWRHVWSVMREQLAVGLASCLITSAGVFGLARAGAGPIVQLILGTGVFMLVCGASVFTLLQKDVEAAFDRLAAVPPVAMLQRALRTCHLLRQA